MRVPVSPETIAPLPAIGLATHPELYRDWRAALTFCRAIPDAPPRAPTTFHLYWRQARAGWFQKARPFGRKQALPVKSFFATQDLSCCTLTIWSDGDLSDNAWLQPFRDRLVFRTYRPDAEVAGTALEARPDLYGEHDRRVWRDGDLFRILVLHNYGGVYIDADLVLLRSLGPLLDREFVYQWEDFTDQYNGALMHVTRGSGFARELIAGIMELRPGGFAWGRENLRRAIESGCDVTVWPCAFFDAEWQERHVFTGFARAAAPLDPYEGAFAWHWHNQWDARIEDGSRFHLYETAIDRRLVDLGFTLR
jgi:hypothetical protein